MKKLIAKILGVSGLALLVLSSCKKNDALVTESANVTPGALTASTTSPVLNKLNVASTATLITFNFTQPNFGFAAAVTNTLQIDAPGDNWAAPYSISMGTNVFTQSFTTATFNNILLKLGLIGGTTSSVNVRISSSIGVNVAPTLSNVLAISVTPFNLTSWLYIVGQFNGYSTSAPDSLISPTSNGIYTGILNVTTGNNQFLVLPAKNFNNKYATTTSLSGTATSLTYATEYVTGGGNNLYAPTTPGYYFISLNINTNSISISPANTYSAIGNTVGDAGGYSVDVPLTKFINDGKTGWQGVVAFNVGNFKIRQDKDWTNSWGILATPDGMTLTDASGGNIPITVAGNYLVSFDIAASAMGATAATSNPPSATATYTLVKQ